MEILAAFDLMGSFHAAADVAGCSHHTVARVVAERDAGARPGSCRPRLVDEFLPKIEEWVEKSNGKIRADVADDAHPSCPELLIEFPHLVAVSTLADAGACGAGFGA